MGIALSQVSTISGKSSDIDRAFIAAIAGAPRPPDQSTLAIADHCAIEAGKVDSDRRFAGRS
jgi:hypothetical protein